MADRLSKKQESEHRKSTEVIILATQMRQGRIHLSLRLGAGIVHMVLRKLYD